MTALKIIGIILLVFLLIGFVRVGALASFGDELCVKLRVGFIRLTIFPEKEKKPKKPKKREKTERGEAKGREAKEKALPSAPDAGGYPRPRPDGAFGARGDGTARVQARAHRPAGCDGRVRRRRSRHCRSGVRRGERGGV
jgi:hypothetical protein